MELTKIILEFLSSLAWPLVILFIAVMFKKPIFSLLGRIDAIADRASKDSFDLQLGEKIKLSFKDAINKANPKTVEEAVNVAEKEVDKVISAYDILSNIPMKQHHKDLLLKIAKGGSKGITWVYGGNPDEAPGKTMSYLITRGLVARDENTYVVAHKLVRDFIFKSHS